MSKIQSAQQPSGIQPAVRQPVRRVFRREDLSNLPTRKGRDGAIRFYREIGVYSITHSRLRHATERGELRRFKIASHNWYSDQDLFDFLMALASGGKGGAA